MYVNTNKTTDDVMCGKFNGSSASSAFQSFIPIMKDIKNRRATERQKQHTNRHT
jgi:hypothetical protein